MQVPGIKKIVTYAQKGLFLTFLSVPESLWLIEYYEFSHEGTKYQS
jgi:hypothetical protein